MADGNEITREQRDRFLRWLEQRVAKPIVCPVCGEHEKWGLADHRVVPPIWGAKGGMVIGGTAYPQYMLICGNCAHTLFFNSILPKRAETEAGEKEKGKEKEGSGSSDHG